MSVIRLPFQCTFHDWMIDLVRSRPTLNVPIPLNQKRSWHYAARQLIQWNGGQLAGVPFPSESRFPKEDDWKHWAKFLIQTLN